MKRILSLILTLVLITTSVSVIIFIDSSAESVNLLAGYTLENWTFASDRSGTEYTSLSKNGGYAFGGDGFYRGFHTSFFVNANTNYTLSFSMKATCTIEYLVIESEDYVNEGKFNSEGKINGGFTSTIDLNTINSLIYTGDGSYLTNSNIGEWIDVEYEFTPQKSGMYFLAYSSNAKPSGSLADTNVTLISDLCLVGECKKLNEYIASDWVLATDKSHVNNTEVVVPKNGGSAFVLKDYIWRGLYTAFTVEPGVDYTLSFSTKTNMEYEYIAITDRTDLAFKSDGKTEKYNESNSSIDIETINQKMHNETDLSQAEWCDISYNFTSSESATYYIAISFKGTGTADVGSRAIISDLRLTKKEKINYPEGTITVSDWILPDDKTVEKHTEVVDSKSGDGYAFMLKGFIWRGLYTSFDVEKGTDYVLSFSTKTNTTYEYMVIESEDYVNEDKFNSDGKISGGFASTIDLTSINENLSDSSDLSLSEWHDVSYRFTALKTGKYYVAISLNASASSSARSIISDFKLTKINSFVPAVSADENLGLVEPKNKIEVADGQEISISAKPLSDNEFLGWYDESDNLISKDQNFTYACRVDDLQTYKAKFNAGHLSLDNASFENTVSVKTLAWLDKSTGELMQNNSDYVIETYNREEFYQSMLVSTDKAYNGDNSLMLITGASYAGYKIRGLEKNKTYSLSYYINLSTEGSINTYVTSADISPFVEYEESYEYYIEKISPNALGKTLSVKGQGDWQKITVSFNTDDTTDVILWWNFNGANLCYVDTLSLVKSHLVNIIGGKGGSANATEVGYVEEGKEITFIASPLEGNTFVGWFTNNKNELFSDQTTFTKTITESIDLYAKFSGTKFPIREIFSERSEDGTFENGSIKGWKASDPEYPYHNNRWCSWTVSEKQAYEGENSLRINARIRNTVLPIENLNKNTNYQLSFYVYQPDVTDKAYIEHFAVVDSKSEHLSTAKKVYAKTEGKLDGGSGWYKINLYFETQDEINVNFIIRYWAPDGALDSSYLYIDNLSLVEYASNADIKNGDFNNSDEYWMGDGEVICNGSNCEMKLSAVNDVAYQIVNIGTNKRALVKFKAKGKVYAAASDVSAFEPAVSNAISGLSYVNTVGDWNEYEFEVYASSNPDIMLSFKSIESGAMIDDVTLEVLDDSIGGIVENIDFETERFDIKNSDPNLWSIYEKSNEDDFNVYSGNKSLHLSFDPDAEIIKENLLSNITIADFTLAQNLSAANNTEIITSKNGGYAFMLKGHKWQGMYLPVSLKGGEEYTFSFFTKSNVKYEYIAVTNRTDLAFREDDGKTPMFSEGNSTIDVNALNEKIITDNSLTSAEWCEVSYTFKPEKTETYYFAIAFTTGTAADAKTMISDLSLVKMEDNTDSDLFNEAYMSYGAIRGVSYKISLYYKIVDGKNGGSICITPEKSGSICKEVGLNHSAQNSNWQRLEFLFVNSKYTNLRNYIANIVESKKCDIYIDDIKIEVVQPLIVDESINDSYAELIYNVIENGAFEEEVNDNNYTMLPSMCVLITDEEAASSGSGYLKVTKGTKYILPIKVKSTTIYNFGITLKNSGFGEGFVGIASSISPKELYFVNSEFETVSKLNVEEFGNKWQRKGFKLITDNSGYIYLVIECTKGEFCIDTLMLFEETYAMKKDINDYTLPTYYDYDDLNSLTCIYNGGYEDLDSPSTGDSGLPFYLILIMGGALLVMIMFAKKGRIVKLSTNTFSNAICLFLAFTLSLSLLGGCSNKSNNQNNSSVASDTQDTASDTIDDNQNAEESDEGESETDASDEEFYEEKYTDEEYYEEEYEAFDPYKVKFEVYNNSEPINTNYRGVSSSVYHAFGFMKDQYDGRVYTDKMMDLELDRLVDSGIKYTRTRYDSKWAWDTASSKYDWSKDRFQYFLDYAEELQNRDVNVAIQLGWEFNALVYNISDHGLGEVDYLLGRGNDVYGESAGYDFQGKTDEEIRLIKASNRIGHWMAESLKQAKAQRGINNITHLYYFTEPSGGSIFKNNNLEGEEAEEYLLVCTTIKNKLVEEGVASWTKHVGPNQGFANQGSLLLKYVIDREPDLFDIWTTHSYPKSDSILNNVYYDILFPQMEMNIDYVKAANRFENTEFWWDELNATSTGLTTTDSSGWLGLQQVVCYLAGQYAGVDNINMWQIFDQLFTDYLAEDGGEFVSGIHVCGTAPSLFVSSVPRAQYYFTSLFSKYNGYKNGTVYNTNNYYIYSISDVYIGVVELESGDYTITIANVGMEDVDFEVVFEKAINKNLYRHTENANKIKPTTKAELAPADATFVNVGKAFKDVIRSGELSIYTSIKG